MGEDEMQEMGEDEMMSGEGEESELEEAAKDPRSLANKQYAEMHSSDGEMGESDMDEYSFDEEGESYYEDGLEDSNEAPQKLIPIPKKKVKSDRDYESDSEEEDDSDESALEDSDDEELDSDEAVDEMENPHGFVYGHHLDTYRRSKKERVAEAMKIKYENRDERREAHRRRDRKTKGASTTNTEK